jgi:hypothetical protein
MTASVTPLTPRDRVGGGFARSAFGAMPAEGKRNLRTGGSGGDWEPKLERDKAQEGVRKRAKDMALIYGKP